MSKLDKLINKFFDNLRNNRLNAFGRSALKNPEIRKSVKKLRDNEKEILGLVKKHFGESISKK
jgi:hypothetical protein